MTASPEATYADIPTDAVAAVFRSTSERIKRISSRISASSSDIRHPLRYVFCSWLVNFGEGYRHFWCAFGAYEFDAFCLILTDQNILGKHRLPTLLDCQKLALFNVEFTLNFDKSVCLAAQLETDKVLRKSLDAQKGQNHFWSIGQFGHINPIRGKYGKVRVFEVPDSAREVLGYSVARSGPLLCLGGGDGLFYCIDVRIELSDCFNTGIYSRSITNFPERREWHARYSGKTLNLGMGHLEQQGSDAGCGGY